MPLQLRLSHDQLADFAVIRDTSPQLLQAITEHFQTVTPRPIRPSELHRVIAQLLGDKPEAANRIMRALLSLQAIIHQRRLTADEVVEAIRQGLEAADPSWKTEELKRWESVESSFKQLLISPVVRLVSTTLDLMYECDNLLQISRVLTDIRPVFSEDASSIEGSVVLHTLRLRYDSTEGEHGISIAMDDNDIRELERQCSRALLKAQTVRTLMVKQAKVPTVISGDSSNEET